MGDVHGEPEKDLKINFTPENIFYAYITITINKKIRKKI